MEKTSTGLEANVAGLLCYVAWWVSGLVFILIEKEDKFVRSHAMQSIIVFAAITIVATILSWVFLGWIIWLLGVALMIVMMVKAYQGTMYKLPWAGNLAEKWVGEKST